MRMETSLDARFGSTEACVRSVYVERALLRVAPAARRRLVGFGLRGFDLEADVVVGDQLHKHHRILEIVVRFGEQD
jgi:hypothetical protein